MRALFGILGLLVFIYLRPHEWTTALASIPFLYLFLAATLIGLGTDIASKDTKFVVGPQLGYAVMFQLWCTLSLVMRVPDQVGAKMPLVLICFLLYFLIAHSLQKVKSLTRVVGLIFACGLFVATCCVYQGTQDWVCIKIDPKNHNGPGKPTTRSCWTNPEMTAGDASLECMATGRAGVPYRCERPGFFDTSSIGGGRVRYLGVLQDPNECALATVLAVPFAFSFFERKRSTSRLLLLLATLGIIATVNIMTKSRGGQLVFGTTLGAYFIRKFGYKKGLMVAATAAIPALVMGGRGGAEASQSTMDRLEAAAAAIKMMISNPLIGAGYTQFTEHHHLTAHNAYLLAVGETGFPGMVLFVCNVYLGVKIPASVLRHNFAPGPDVETIKSLAMALLATFTGMCVGIFFLSWTYHYVLWIHFGLSGSLYSVIKTRDRKFKVSLTATELIGITVGCVLVLVFLVFHTKRKGCW